MKIDTSCWEEFILEKLFEIKKGKRLTSADQEQGDNNYIGAIDSNNGIANHIAQNPIHSGNTITLSYNGSVGEAFYQDEPYWATDDVNALYSRYEGFNKYIGLFIVSVLRQEKYRFSYGRKWTLENMKSTIIKLPVLKNADDSVFIDATYKYSNKGYVPDWGFMESYIRSLNYKPLTTENKQSSTQFLNDNWKDFTVKELFKVVGSKTTKKEDLEEIGEGIYPYITTSASNNGVDGHYDFWTEEGNVITVESACMGFSTYQEEKFSASDHVEILKPYFNLNKYIAIFIITIINNENFKYSYGRKCNQTKINNMVLRLPVTESDEPDWAYMEDYIKSLPYGDRV